MPANDGSGADGSQKLKPKLSKTKLKAAGGSTASPSSAGSAGTSGKSLAPKKPGATKPSGAAPKPGAVSGLKPKVSGAAPKVTDKPAKVADKTPKVSSGSSKESDRSWAAKATGSGSSSSTALKVKKKKSSAEGKALSPKKSSLRKSSPADTDPIKPTEDLEPLNAEETPEEIEDTTVAYTEPPEEAEGEEEDPDGVTETFVLDTSKEEKDEDSDADEDQEAEAVAEEESDEEKADEKESADEAEAEAEVDEEAEEPADDLLPEGEDEKPAKKSSKKSDAKASGRANVSDRRRGRASKRTDGVADGEGDAKAQERSSKRSAAQKKADRSKVKLFLFFAIGSIVGLILIPIVMWWKGMWPFEANRPKDEALVYAVPAYPGETFATLIQEFTPEANPETLLTEKNPNLPLDKPFTAKTKVVVGIPKLWKFTPTGDTSFIQHFLAEAQQAAEQEPPDIGKANQNLLMAQKMLARFVLNGDSNDATKKDWQNQMDEVKDLVTTKEGGTPEPRSTPPPPKNNGGASNPPPPGPPPPSQAEQTKAAKERVAPIYANLAKIRPLLGTDKAEALKLMKTTLTQLDDLHSIDPSMLLLKPVDDLLNKEADLQGLYDKGAAVTAEEYDAAKFPTLEP